VSWAFPVLVASLFLVFSCLFEVIPGAHYLRPQLILAGLGLLILVPSGQAIRVTMTPVGKSLLIFTAWFMVCIPFAIWRGGSVKIFIDIWYKSVLMFVLTAGLLSTAAQARKLFHVIGYAVSLMALIALAENTYQLGRLTLLNARYGNSNELGVSLLVGLTFLAYSFRYGNRRESTVAAVLSAPVLLALVKTGSRSAMLGAALLCLSAFLQASRKTRSKMMAFAPLILVALAIVVPSNLRHRYFTLFGSSGEGAITKAEYKEYLAATASAEARLTLLKDSLIVTVHHPIFGVGPGNFPVEQNNLAVARGELGMWHLTHNSYTQVSSEMGIPGLVLYLIFLYRIFKVLTSIVRREQEGEVWSDLRRMAHSLRFAFILLATVALFDSVAYIPEIPIMAGLAVALGDIVQRQEVADQGGKPVARNRGRVRVMIPNRPLAAG
jgi:O-antigen ligase